MSEEGKSHIRLGLFVLAGLFLLILTLYMIGRNQNLFGSTFKLRARFRNVSGLITGDNIQFSGIQAGTVKSITLIDDTTIEVGLIIDKAMKAYIHRDAIASIGTEGLMGNEMVTILPGDGKAPAVGSGDLLASKTPISTAQMLHKLDQTDDNIADISGELKATVQRFNNSKALWGILNDASLPSDMKTSFDNISHASADANGILSELHSLVSAIKSGKGSVGALLVDTSFAHSLQETVTKIKTVGDKADGLATDLDAMAGNIQQDIRHGSGTVHALLEDSVMANKLNASLGNVQKGTEAFSQDMVALQHNFLLRGFFRRQAKHKKEAKEQ